MSTSETPPPESRGDLTPADLAEPAPENGTGLLNGPLRLLLPLACAVIVIVGMRYGSAILSPIFMAMFIVMGLSPILNWLRRKGAPPWATLVIVLVGFVVIALVFVGIMAGSLAQLDSKLPVYRQSLSDMTAGVQAWFAGHGMDVSGLLSGKLSPATIMNFASSMIVRVINSLTSAVLMILIVVFMIAQVYSFPRKLYERLNLSRTFDRAFHEFGEVTRSYLFTLTWINALSAVITTVVYFAFGVDFALLWGVVFFVLSYIPNIGFVLSVIPPFFVTLLEFDFKRAAIVVIIVIFFNALVNNAVTPRFMSRRTGISTLAVFLSLVVWSWVLGAVGALMAVPLTLMVKLLFLDSFESTRKISMFIEGGSSGKRSSGRKKGSVEIAAGESGQGK
jgi:AI-2 transport protein TqsA